MYLSFEKIGAPGADANNSLSYLATVGGTGAQLGECLIGSQEVGGSGLLSWQRALTKPEAERMDYLEFIARVVSHIPDKGQVTVSYFGLFANAQEAKYAGPTRQASFHHRGGGKAENPPPRLG